MSETINKKYLESLLQEPINQEAEAIASLLAERAKLGFRHLSVCSGKRQLFQDHQTTVIDLLKQRGIRIAGEEGYPFSCSCATNVTERCSHGCVFFF